MISLRIPGDPVPQQRARKGKQGHWYTPTESAEYQERIARAWQASGEETITDPVTISARFACARKPSHLTPKGKLRKGAPPYPAPDVDNYVKGLLDGLQPHAFPNDSQVVRLATIDKRYAEPGEEGYTEVQIRRAIDYMEVAA